MCAVKKRKNALCVALVREKGKIRAWEIGDVEVRSRKDWAC